MKPPPKYYVYEIWDPLTEVCRYVGKGYGKRAKDQANPERITNEKLRKLVENCKNEGFEIEPIIVYRHNIEAEVLRKEMALIAKYGRLGIEPDGTLYNITAGGQGIVGRGKPVTIAGILYSTMKEAADAYDINEFNLRRRLSKGWTAEETVGLVDRPRTSKRNKAVKINDIVYPSQEEACRTFGVSSAMVISRIKRGWTIEEAYGVIKRLPKQNRPITVDGLSFNSVKEAAQYFRVRSDATLARIKRGWSPEEAFGVRRRQRVDQRHTESDVIDIRQRYAKGQSSNEIAKYYGIDQSAVLRICYGESYSNFGGPIVLVKQPRKDRLSSKAVLEIRYEKKAGTSNRTIAGQYNIDLSTVSNICTGKSYKHVGGPIVTGQRRLNGMEVEQIRTEKRAGKSLKEIAELWHLHLDTVRRICSKKR